MTQLLVEQKLQSLVGQRFTKETIESKLTQLFGVNASVFEYDVNDSQIKLDNILICSILNEDVNLNIDLDLYYLLDNGGNYYITEVGFHYV